MKTVYISLVGILAALVLILTPLTSKREEKVIQGGNVATYSMPIQSGQPVPGVKQTSLIGYSLQ